MTASPRHWLIRLTNLLLDYRAWWLAASTLVTLAAILPASRLQYEQSIESLYANDSARLDAWRQSKLLFGGDEFVVVVYTDEDLFDAENDKLTAAARDRIEALADQLKEVPGLQTESLQHLAHALRAPIRRSAIRKLMEGALVSTDGRTTAIFCRLEPAGASPVPRAETYRRAREIADAHHPPAAVVGEPVQVHEMFRYVEQDGATLGIASSVVLMGVVFVLFRSLRWMILPMLVVQITLIWTKACLALGGMKLSMLGAMLNLLVTIIGVATVMHVMLRFREHRRTNQPVEALRRTMLELSVPLFWITATTATGFAALLTSQIAPIASFGVIMTLATCLLLVSCAVVLPGAILMGESPNLPGQVPWENRASKSLGEMAAWIEHHPILVMSAIVLLVAPCAAGLFRLNVEADFSKNFRTNSPIVRSLDLFETRMSGAGMWEVNLPAPPELDKEFLGHVHDLVAELRTLEDQQSPGKLTKVVSLTDGLDVLDFLPLSWRLSALERMQPDFITSLYNSEAGRLRIMLRARERQPSDTKLKLIHKVEELARQQFPEARATGLFVLLTYLTESLMRDQLNSSLMAAAAIVILMTLAYRNLALGLIVVIPNLFPIVLVIGTTGWIGLPINLATAMVASVSLGLTVTFSIYYVAGYTAARARELSYSAAARHTHESVGLALVFANVTMVAGFSMLGLSHFMPLVYFGILLGAAIIGGLICNLVFLPLLLRLVDRK